ncbi:alpha/beta hydrolase [Nocardiopsis sp. JB363]|uniref:alpha/beta hydrolase n=1 Tax=Nocardiopsis sp. JB363 TaxID=1434837 RepID=UPI00097B5413|nr:alpha/beta hydrolase [Nocardiopsis sp. JB363]SIO88288.1 hypothetical protein BQ8420_18625 [Nocardiopsis sp. JB363]
MSVETMTLGLPEDVDADPAGIRDSAEDLMETRNAMLGHSADLESGFWAASDEFTDAIAWDIKGASVSDIESWQAVAELLTGGSGTLDLYAEAVEAYREVRGDIQGRWDTYKSNALRRIEENGADTLTINGDTQEEAERTYLDTVRTSLLGEHTDARNDLDDETEDANKALREGPCKGMWQRFVDAGLMSGKETYLFGGEVYDTVDFSPAEDWTPEQVAQWWHDLAPNQQEYAMEEYGEELRNQNGIPSVVRDELNRDRLQLEIDRLSGSGTGHLWYQLEQMREIEESIEGDGALLLHFDPYVDGGGQVAVSYGDPDHAHNVSTLVQGMSNDMGAFEDPAARGRQIREAMENSEPGQENASVVWTGYDTPPGGGFDPTEGAEQLIDFQDGLRASHRGDEPSHNTVMGHSFGALVVGAADSQEGGGGLAADALVFIGGAGASVDNITDLSVDPNDIHVVEGDEDWIRHRDKLDSSDDHYGEPLANGEFFEDPNNPGESLGHHLDPEEETGHADYFEDEETLDYLGDVATSGS